ncbi:MAG: MFS transporter [Clostridia bacterium]|nr:MFS transporter [Clostridia bacterium]MBQ9988384.1 MFS transporter [Clostridia bacterium]
MRKVFAAYDFDQEPKTLWNLPFIMVLVIGFITGTANQMVNPLLGKYTVGLGATLTLAGTIVGLQSGASMVLRPVSGAASDKLNRKLVFFGSIVVTGVAYMGYMLFRSIPMVMICRMLQGVGFSFMSVARTAFASSFMPKDRIGEGVGYTTFGVVLSQAVGPSIGIWIADNLGYFYCFLIAFLFCAFGSVVMMMIPYKPIRLPETVEKGKRKFRLGDYIAPAAIPYSLLAGLFAIQIHLPNAFLELLAGERGIGGVGLYFTAYSLVAIVTRPMAGRILDKKGLTTIIIPGYIFCAVSMLLIGNASSTFMIILAGIFRAFGQGSAQPGVQAVAIKRLGTEKAGVAMATVMLGQDCLAAITPAIGGVVATATSYRTMFNLTSLVMLSGIAIYFLIISMEKKYEAKKQLAAEEQAQ